MSDDNSEVGELEELAHIPVREVSFHNDEPEDYDEILVWYLHPKRVSIAVIGKDGVMDVNLSRHQAMMLAEALLFAARLNPDDAELTY